MRFTLVFVVIIFYLPFPGFSQVVDTIKMVDTVQVVDTIYTTEGPVLVEEVEYDYSNRYVPRKASLYSAVLPGLGQAYNKDFWKIPIVYGGFTTLFLTVDFYHDNYSRFRKDLFAEVDDNPLTTNRSGFNTQQLRRLVERTRRERDFYIIISGVLYLLQIAEAHIDAHLKEFDINPNLQVKVEPMMRYNEGINSGFSLTLKF